MDDLTAFVIGALLHALRMKILKLIGFLLAVLLLLWLANNLPYDPAF